MAGRKKKRDTKSDAATSVADAPGATESPAGKSPAAAQQIKWRWPVVLSALVALSVLVLFLSWIKFFDLIGLDRGSQDLLISYVGDTQSTPFDNRVALILVDKDKPATQPDAAAAAPNQPPPVAVNQPPGAANQIAANQTSANQIYGASSPSHRKYHIELIRSLAKAGAKVVVFDVLFITSLAETDPEFAKTIQESEKAGTKIVVGAFLQPGVYQPQITAAIKTAVSDHWGIVDGGTQKKSDALLIRLAAETSNEQFNGFDEKPVFPSLALQAVRFLKYPHAQTSAWFSPLSGQVRLRNSEASSALLEAVPVNRDLYLLVDLPGKDEIPHFSYQEVLAHANDYAPNFKDKIVVVGYQEGDALPSSAWQKETRYGAEIHAAAMSTLLTGTFLKPLPVLYHYIFIVALVAIAAFLQVRFSKWMERTQTVPLPLLPAPFNKITIPTPILVISLGYLLFAVLVFKTTQVVFDMSYHLAALVLTYSLFFFCGPLLTRK